MYLCKLIELMQDASSQIHSIDSLSINSIASDLKVYSSYSVYVIVIPWAVRLYVEIIHEL